MKFIISGACGLVGSSCVRYFSKNKNNKIYGIDNNARKYFFGELGSVHKNVEVLSKISNYEHYDHTIIDKQFVFDLVKKIKPDVIINCCGQPSHDWAAKDVFLDFNTNCTSVLYLLEAARLFSKDVVFLQLSSDKVYGTNTDTKIKLKELETRYEYDDLKFEKIGIDETMSIDNTLHSLFGCGKVASDVYAQEYSAYYGMNVSIFRPCCIVGGGDLQSGAPLHGFLNFLVRATIKDIAYELYGYKGKQVRSNIHANDLVRAFDEVIQNPISGVFNIGGSFKNSCSIIEAIDLIYQYSNKKLSYTYVDKPRIGDHCVYYENLNKFKSHYPKWNITWSLEDIIKDIVKSYQT